MPLNDLLHVKPGPLHDAETKVIPPRRKSWDDNSDNSPSNDKFDKAAPPFDTPPTDADRRTYSAKVDRKLTPR